LAQDIFSTDQNVEATVSWLLLAKIAATAAAKILT
jgi:hypothetical protein